MAATAGGPSSGGGNGDIKRIANLLLETSKQAKSQLTEQHQTYITWLCGEFTRVKSRWGTTQVVSTKAQAPAAAAPSTRGKRKAESPEPVSGGEGDAARLVPQNLRVVDLRRELRGRGLATSGKKEVLVARLEEALAEIEFEGEKENALPQIDEANEDQEEHEPVSKQEPPVSRGADGRTAPVDEVAPEDLSLKQSTSTSSRSKKSTASSRPDKAAVAMEVVETPTAVEESGSTAMEVDMPAESVPAAPTGGKAKVSAEKTKQQDVSAASSQAPEAPEPMDISSPCDANKKQQEEASASCRTRSRSRSSSSAKEAASSSTAAITSTSPVTTALPDKTQGPVRRSSTSLQTQAAAPATAQGSQPPKQLSPKKCVSSPAKTSAPPRLPAAAPASASAPATALTSAAPSAPAAAPMSYLDPIARALNGKAATVPAAPAPKPASRRSSVHKPGVPTTGIPQPKTSRRLSQVGKAPAPSLPEKSPVPVAVPSKPTQQQPSQPPPSMGGAVRVTADEAKRPTEAVKSSAATAVSGLLKPSNLLGGLHSLTSLMTSKAPPAEASHTNTHKVEVPALKKAQEARRLELAKAEERQRLKDMREQQMEQRRLAAAEERKNRKMAIDASRLEQEANKKRAELAAKRKEREEKFKQPGAFGQPAPPSSSSTTAFGATKPSTADPHKKPRIEGQQQQQTAPASSLRPAAPSTTSTAAAHRPEPPPSSSAPATAPAGLKPPLKEISANTSASAVAVANTSVLGAKKIPELVAKPSSSSSQAHSASTAPLKTGQLTGLASAATSSSAAYRQTQQDQDNNYPISDRDESSDDDYESDEGNKDDKVPDWARGEALKKAIHRQFYGEKRLDPDSIFVSDVGECDLDDVFKGCAEEGKKQRSYRTRQSTGNWVKDQLSTVEKVRYRRAMGWR